MGGVCIAAEAVGGVRRGGHLCVCLLAVGGGERVSVLRCQDSHVACGIVC